MKNLRETLLAKTQRRYTTVEIEGDEFCLQSLTELERSQQEATMIDRKTMKIDFRKLPESKLKMICLCLVDPESKEVLFEPHEWVALQALDSRVVNKLYNACADHNGWEEKVVEELVGN